MKNIIIISSIIGAIIAVLALIPFVIKIVIFLLMTSVSLATIIYLQQKGLLSISNLNECLKIGTISGFVSFIVFATIFLPLVYLLSLFIPITYMGGLVLALKLSNFALITMFTLFISTISVLFNAFSAFLWYCLNTKKLAPPTENITTFKEQLDDKYKNIQ